MRLRCHSHCIPFVLGVCLVGGATARAALIVPTDDNNVLKNQGAQTNGATFTLKVASASQSNARVAFLKFDLTSFPSITDPVTFTATTAGAAGTDFTFQLYGLLSGDPAGFDWTESTITYANRPAPSDAGVLVNTTLAPRLASDQTVTLATGSPAGAALSFTFTGLENLRQSDNTATLMLLISSQISNTPTLGINSSEATSGQPTLDIPVPEPTSIALLAVGAMVTLARRRRA